MTDDQTTPSPDESRDEARPARPDHVPPTPMPPSVPAGYALRPERKSGGFGRGFGTGLGFALGAGAVVVAGSVLSLILMVVSAASLAGGASPGASTALSTVWGDAGAKHSLRAIPIQGAIMADASDGSVLAGGTYGYEVADTIRGLDKEDAAGIVLLVNTPGGSVVGSAAIADAVTDYQQRTGQKVLVHISSMSASGGVYSTSSADEIWADEGSLVGSIGVISGPFQRYTNVTRIGDTLFSAGVEAERIEQEYLAAGRGKAFGDPFNDMDPESRKQWIEMINASYDQFVARMVQGRGMDEQTIRNEMGAGIFDTAKAKEYKLIDGVSGRDAFFRHAAEAAGLDPEDTKVEQFTQDAGLLGQILGVERAYGQAPAAVQGEGVTPSLSQSICGAQAIIALHGPKAALCG